MKELSIKEKAEAYDYAVNKAKELILNENGVVRVDKPLFDELFPSKMEESEDERIRNWLIGYFHQYKEDGVEKYANGLKVESIIAWLEKQGTPAKLSEEEQNRFVKCVLTSCAMSFIDYLDAHKYEGKMCVSNGECEDIENAFHNAMWDKLHRYYGKYIEKQGEKPQCKSALEAAKEEKVDNAEKKEPKKIEQKPWSEEDNFMYNKIKNLLTDISLAPESIKSLSDWLKDLRDRVQPQTTWKPSDEQMEALEHFVRSIAESGFASPYDSNTKLVYSLFNDLKKLREE